MLIKPFNQDDKYLIYSDGRVFSKKTNTFLKGMIDSSGYHCYLLCINGKSKFIRTNRLIATHFIENDNPKEKTIVNHIDGNKLNNDMTNLEWVSYSENTSKYYTQTQVKYQNAIYSIDNKNEQWIDIKGFPRYEISSLGQIRVKRTKRLMRADKYHKYARMILIDENNKRVHVLVHRLVYANFHQDWDFNGFVIDHIDANPRNNEVSNLQKITPKENSQRQERFKK